MAEFTTLSDAIGQHVHDLSLIHILVDGLDEAIAVANETPWGLGGSIWASDAREIERAIAGIDAGMVYANAIVASSPELPFGGIKNSGYGRELSTMGIREFTNAKTFYIA